MMSSWKFTKKLKDFSRSKSPAASPSPSPSTSNQKESSNSLDLPSAETKHSNELDRRSTVTPDTINQHLKVDSNNNGANGGTTDALKSSNSSSHTVTSNNKSSNSLNQQVQQQEIPENNNFFKPGLLTLKIYNGNNFKIPFDINNDKSILSKLNQNNDQKQNTDLLISKLNQLNLNDEKIPSEFSNELIPASIKIPPSNNKTPLIYFTLEFDKTIISIEPEFGSIKKPYFNKVSNFDVTKISNELKFQIFLKIPKILSGLDTEDILISSTILPLNFTKTYNTPIRIKNHEVLKFNNDYPEWSEQFNGDLIISIDFKPNENKHLTIDDFDLLKVIGKGSFGKVMQVRKKDSQKIYALKAIRKSHIVSKSEVTHTLAERTVLAQIDNPFIVPLKFSFQSPEKLYFVLNFINGGELFYHLQKEGRFELSRARFYTCELLIALECLHSFNIIYRDLKPENILLDYKGHIALCDFGLCKLNMKNDDKTSTFCGTPEYLAPELLLGQGYTKNVDWWTLGVLLYEMLTGLPPYYDEDVPTMYRKIMTNPLKFPENFDKDCKDLLIHLLNRDPTKRLGCNGSEEIKKHKFFSKIDWKKLYDKNYLPPFKPPVIDSFDTSNFDQEFTKEKPVDSVLNDYLSDSVQKQFGGWTYVGTEQLGQSR
ncbi:Serine/threonine-protein kinase [Wickerhamomyces ciferrii]|uniref:non-specific serine/threonine protein kinase n=1 Tax=Wickerhamomyces ciferrii (strain ATCC 14091 / BCRC 22168 / CBS 111 / JCM 3599 / NBRC 0793 / NRRL Y-1031 F-60-10) TaxID=1206466 RepID=K0KTA5_WICCF|nr:Serine/threonine-protein kinase [Wickerhamomyces ciferrii]CCH46391.1 Serine/threonine-protein kinase [Wickerhamomyces ciferrii]